MPLSTTFAKAGRVCLAGFEHCGHCGVDRFAAAPELRVVRQFESWRGLVCLWHGQLHGIVRPRVLLAGS
jgi:hypothetical protein